MALHTYILNTTQELFREWFENFAAGATFAKGMWGKELLPPERDWYRGKGVFPGERYLIFSPFPVREVENVLEEFGTPLGIIGTITRTEPDPYGILPLERDTPILLCHMLQLSADRLRVNVETWYDESRLVQMLFGQMEEDLYRDYPEARPAEWVPQPSAFAQPPEGDGRAGEGEPAKPGRRELSRDERVFRATCALWAEELRYNEDVTWPDVCKAISWANSVTLLRQDAMNRLVRLRREDPEGILPEAERKLKELQNGKKGKQ